MTAREAAQVEFDRIAREMSGAWRRDEREAAIDALERTDTTQVRVLVIRQCGGPSRPHMAPIREVRTLSEVAIRRLARNGVRLHVSSDASPGLIDRLLRLGHRVANPGEVAP